ncbi:MAG: hypothetical protein JWQ28_2451 [Pedobacter sp.]|nr:hypothetical protein [Pedobacter sp.]
MFEDMHRLSGTKQKLIISVFLPWVLSMLFGGSPLISFNIAWLGSFFIFYCSILSPIRCVSTDASNSKRAMRPIVLLQLVFAGFMCSTSIFYFLDHLGYEFFTDVNRRNFVVNTTTYQLANCQRYYVLAHACLVAGLVIASRQQITVSYVLSRKSDSALIKASVISFMVSVLLSKLPAFVQFSLMLRYVAEFGATLILVKGLHGKNVRMVLFGGGFFLYNLLSSSLTGYKEGVIIKVIILFFILLPYYKKQVLALCLPTMLILFYILPTLATTIRANVWTGDATSEQARNVVYQTLISADPLDEISNTNWIFLEDRFSEIGMFTQYVSFVPFQHDYYTSEILGNSLAALIPRALWENKPDTEKLSMQRVYDSGVVNRLSDVSAKTRPIVDGYLAGGTVGICIVMLVYGLTAQAICNQAERMFGGYETGCIIVFNGIFQQLWRGNNLEFLINNVFYGYLLMLFLFQVLKRFDVLSPVEPQDQ